MKNLVRVNLANLIELQELLDFAPSDDSAPEAPGA